MRRVKDVPDMHIGSYEFYAYYENRKEATGSASTRTRRKRFAYHPSHPRAAENVNFRRARAQVLLAYGTMVVCPTTPLDPGDSRSVEAHEEYAIMCIAMFGNMYRKISPAAQHSDLSSTSPASPHCHRLIVAPPDARFMPQAGETWMDAWERERVAMKNKRRRVCDRLLENNIVRARNTARTEVLVQRDEMRQGETDAGTPKTPQEHAHQVDPTLQVFVVFPEAVPRRTGKLNVAAEYAEEVRVMLRHDKPTPSQETTRNIATVRATPKHFRDHEARWKHDVKGYSRRAANERQGETENTAGVGGDEADASGRASTTFVSVEPRPCTPVAGASVPTPSSRPTWDMLPHKPNIEETTELFHVAKEQHMTLHLGCQYMLDLLSNGGSISAVPPLRVKQIGPPGTGKSAADIAIVWFAHQHWATRWIAVTTNTHQAVINLMGDIGPTTADMVFGTSSDLFKLR
jgi:hypothetical protein